MTKRFGACSAALLAVMLLPSCAALDVEALSAVGESQSGYEVTIEFANVLNLPGQAKVMMDGVQVGDVRGVSPAQGHVDVDTQIYDAVAIPANVHATLQQATVLGDIYVAFERDIAKPVDTPLRAGERIPLDRTTSPPPLEDTLAKLAMFIGSGTIQRLQNSVIRLNYVSPPVADIHRIASQVSADLSDLSNNINVVDNMLGGVSQTATVLKANTPNFQAWTSPFGQKVWNRALSANKYLAVLLPSAGTLYNGGFWLVPMLDSLGNAFNAVKHSKWAVEDEIPAWRRWFTDYFLPQDKYPAINITSVIGPDGRELLPNVHDVLRILGAMP